MIGAATLRAGRQISTWRPASSATTTFAVASWDLNRGKLPRPSTGGSSSSYLVARNNVIAQTIASAKRTFVTCGAALRAGYTRRDGRDTDNVTDQLVFNFGCCRPVHSDFAPDQAVSDHEGARPELVGKHNQRWRKVTGLACTRPAPDRGGADTPKIKFRDFDYPRPERRRAWCSNYLIGQRKWRLGACPSGAALCHAPFDPRSRPVRTGNDLAISRI
jgi:hypothetical protein